MLKIHYTQDLGVINHHLILEKMPSKIGVCVYEMSLIPERLMPHFFKPLELKTLLTS